MATIVPTRALVRRLLPAILLEFAAAVSLVFGGRVVRVVVRHRGEWRWQAGPLSSKAGGH